MAQLGISWNLQFIDPPPDDCICFECNCVLRKPMVTHCCRALYCEGCIEDPYDENTVRFSCPRCDNFDIGVTFDGNTWKRILELKVRCPFLDRGCQWIGKLGSRKNHIDPLYGNCDFADKICRFECGEKLSDKNELAEHMEKLCPKRPTTCLKCNEEGQYDFIKGRHKHECPINSSLEQFQIDLLQGLPNDCTCPQCKHVLKRLMLTRCCNLHFCASCIEDPYDWKTLSYNCPECERYHISAQLDNSKWKKILKLHVRCPFSHNGCPWIGELGMRESHLEIDCAHIEVDCTNGCGEKMELEIHLKHSCLRRQDVGSDMEFESDEELYSEFNYNMIPENNRPVKSTPIQKWNYDQSDFVDPPPREYICAKCDNVLAWPMLTGCCSKHFCTSCLDNPYTFNDDVYTKFECPECGPTANIAIVDKQKWEMICKLKVKCPLADRGCYWTGELGERAAHTDNEKGDCDYVELECKYQCGEKFKRYQISEHVEYFCPKRPVTCQYCNKLGEHYIIQGEHKKECPEILIQCPNSCEIESLKQKDLEIHLLECPDQSVECPYSFAGCSESIKRKNFSKHLQECPQEHITLSTKFFEAELCKKEELLQEFTKEKSQRLEQMSQIYSQQVEELQNEKEEQWRATNQTLVALV